MSVTPMTCTVGPTAKVADRAGAPAASRTKAAITVLPTWFGLQGTAVHITIGEIAKWFVRRFRLDLELNLHDGVRPFGNHDPDRNSIFALLAGYYMLRPIRDESVGVVFSHIVFQHVPRDVVDSYFREVPREILEASRMDGATPREELTHVLLPLSMPGIAATALQCLDMEVYYRYDRMLGVRAAPAPK